MALTINDESNFIMDTVINVLKDKEVLTRPQLDTKYAYFKDTYKKLYTMCFLEKDRNTLLRNLAHSLQIREKLKSGEETSFEANVHVSEHFSKKYLYPQFGEPTLEQKKEAIAKIAKDLKKTEKEMELMEAERLKTETKEKNIEGVP